ncbi:50S ribosomal protein L21 [Helicobacter saguini]|uniref:Large ribosomal subunit protein bL21 n=1 Tax=Helicobacter saguini TaxID=1548018 RepID=A0A347VQW9_9HELI|nr:50S ribosomal protein L21 [Helicobacter saguini]MWV63127.1 50S ribosomal protein L21 [Helicobacter saguini]MWV66203.1 50S ribosomal protein L21 [Helicobacter saguini]MWV68552.1 50S ribosomal protein L21 [Helicobacter saguini]MWV71893.1 50S ribosomal protein L21 [Helicobacter saguini]TLD95907.1 50S ribosomal protein L21 [Helicobacter saguini]
MQAIFENGGKQYRAQVGDILLLDKLSLEPKSKLDVENVLAIVDGDNIEVGTPYLSGKKVALEVINEGRGRKVITFKKRRRKDSKTKRGFRRDFTRVKVVGIS